MARSRRTALPPRRPRILRGVPAVLLGSTLAHAQAPAPIPAPGQSPDQNTVSLPDAPSAPGRVLGSVIDSNGNPVTGALISLAPAAGSAPTPVTTAPFTTAEDGLFTFAHVPPGSFTLTVTLSGFAPATATGTLAAGESNTLAPITLHLVASTTVVAIDAHELAAQQVRIEEQQKLVGILPNFFVSYDWYTPALSAGQKFHLAFRNAIDPGSFFAVGITAGIQQATNSFPGYSQGTAGFARRYGADYGNLVSGTFLGGAILPTLFHQDPRYFYKGTGSIRSRTVYALTRPIVARGDNGKWQPAYAGVLGDLSSGAISNLYYDSQDRQGARLTLINGFIGIGGDAVNDLFQEFLLKRFTPKSKNLPPTAP